MAVQFYLGTTRLQLEQKGDTGLTVTGIANVVPAFGFLGIPVIGWLLDTKGYGITLGTINFLGVVASIFQAMPSLWFQVLACQRHPQCTQCRLGLHQLAQASLHACAGTDSQLFTSRHTHAYTHMHARAYMLKRMHRVAHTCARTRMRMHIHLHT